MKKTRRVIRESKAALLERTVKTALAGTDGRFWYERAREVIAAEAAAFGVSRERMAAVLAITSPRVSVAMNWNYASTYIETGRDDGLMFRTRANLAHYEIDGHVRGPKVSAFYRALTGDGSAIVLDTWMAKFFRVPESWKHVQGRAYAEWAIRGAAYILGWEAAQVQAAVWCATVREHGAVPGEFGRAPQ